MSGLTGHKRPAIAEAVDRFAGARERHSALAEAHIGRNEGATAVHFFACAVLDGFEQLCRVVAACGEDLEDAIGRHDEDRRVRENCL